MNRIIVFAVTVGLMLSPGLGFADAIISPGESATFDSRPDLSNRIESQNCPTIGACAAQASTDLQEVQVHSVIFASAEDSGVARATLFAPFVVTGDKPRSIDAQISGDVSWRGELVLLGGLAGSEATISINSSLYDVTLGTVVGSTSVHSASCEADGLIDVTRCRKRQIGNDNVYFDATVIRGHEYELRLTAECKTRSGLLGVDVACGFFPVYDDYGIFDYIDGAVSWNSFTITLGDDIVGMLEEIKEQNEQILRQNEEVIDLLNTPQGQRRSWPNKKR